VYYQSDTELGSFCYGSLLERLTNLHDTPEQAYTATEQTLEIWDTLVDSVNDSATILDSTVSSSCAEIYVPGPSDEVCYGTVGSRFAPPRFFDILTLAQICEVKARFLDDPRIVEKADLQDTTQLVNGYNRLRIAFRKDSFLQSNNGNDFALLNINTSNALRSLNDMGTLRYEVLVAADEWAEKIISFKNLGKAAFLTVEINVYGSAGKCQVVGQVLSKARISLQHPRLCDSHVKYENPHFVSFPHLSAATSGLPTPALTPDIASDMSSSDMNSLLDELDQHEHLDTADIDPRITTTLLR
jgi:hypothetical protein